MAKHLDYHTIHEIFTRLPPSPYRSLDYAVTAAPATRLLNDGDIVDLGDRQFEVIHTPGHSPGEIMLWDAASGILFSGDTVYDGPLIDDTALLAALDAGQIGHATLDVFRVEPLPRDHPTMTSTSRLWKRGRSSLRKPRKRRAQMVPMPSWPQAALPE